MKSALCVVVMVTLSACGGIAASDAMESVASCHQPVLLCLDDLPPREMSGSFTKLDDCMYSVSTTVNVDCDTVSQRSQLHALVLHWLRDAFALDGCSTFRVVGQSFANASVSGGAIVHVQQCYRGCKTDLVSSLVVNGNNLDGVVRCGRVSELVQREQLIIIGLQAARARMLPVWNAIGGSGLLDPELLYVTRASSKFLGNGCEGVLLAPEYVISSDHYAIRMDALSGAWLHPQQ